MAYRFLVLALSLLGAVVLFVVIHVLWTWSLREALRRTMQVLRWEASTDVGRIDLAAIVLFFILLSAPPVLEFLLRLVEATGGETDRVGAESLVRPERCIFFGLFCLGSLGITAWFEHTLPRGMPLGGGPPPPTGPSTSAPTKRKKRRKG
ncbi:MAG TPA: hypothetical protein VM238_07200 [Phycisphaerae bacterium]|nr:hypothetical protein [Phycisphaerae bacterium]